MTETRKKIRKVPNLRFPKFKDEWDTNKLGEIGKFSKGKGISKSDIDENGAIECIRYGELYTNYKEVITQIKSKTNVDLVNLVLSEANDVIIPASGETQIDIATASCVLKSGVALGGDLNIIKTRNNGVFISYYLNNRKKKEIARLAQGVSVVHLYSSQLASLEINLPSLMEQDKIASFISLIDEKIQTQSKIIEELKLLKSTLRNRLIERIIKGKNETLPMKDILEYEQPNKYLVSNTDYSSDSSLVPVLTANKGFILGYTNESFGVYNKGDCIIFDDFTMDLKYVNFPFKIKSSAIKILKPKPNVNLRFVFEYLSFLSLESNGHKRHYISEIELMKIVLPNISLQNNTAFFLSLIDKKIAFETAILKLLTKQKQYLLKNLFI